MNKRNETVLRVDDTPALDEFESIKEIPTRVNLKRMYPQSPWVVIEKSIWWILAIAVVLLGYTQLNAGTERYNFFAQSDSAVKIVFDFMLMVLLTITTIKVLYEVLYHLMYNYTIELEHLVITHGVFMRTRASFPIAKINDASLNRNFIELLLGLYSLNILTASPTLTTGTIKGLRKKEAVDLQAYLMVMLETTLPHINREAIEIIKDRELTRKETRLMEEGNLPIEDEETTAANSYE